MSSLGLSPFHHSPRADACCKLGKIEPKWRNGRRAGLKIRSTQVGVGSSPTFGSKDLRQIAVPQVCPSDDHFTKFPKSDSCMPTTRTDPATFDANLPENFGLTQIGVLPNKSNGTYKAYAPPT